MYDPSLRFCCRKGKDPVEVMAYGSIKEATEAAAELRVHETAATQKKRDDAAAVAGAAKASAGTKPTVNALDNKEGPRAKLDDPTNFEDLEAWYRHFARKKVHEYGILIADSGKSESALVASIGQTRLGNVPGD